MAFCPGQKHLKSLDWQWRYWIMECKSGLILYFLISSGLWIWSDQELCSGDNRKGSDWAVFRGGSHQVITVNVGGLLEKWVIGHWLRGQAVHFQVLILVIFFYYYYWIRNLFNTIVFSHPWYFQEVQEWGLELYRLTWSLNKELLEATRSEISLRGSLMNIGSTLYMGNRLDVLAGQPSSTQRLYNFPEFTFTIQGGISVGQCPPPP